MNFTPFATTFSGSLPTGGGVTQFTTAKFAHQGGGGQVVGLLSADEAGVTYLRPVDNGFTLNLAAAQQGTPNNSDNNPQIITLPISVPGAKPGDLPQQLQIQVVNPNGGGGGGGEKYALPISLQPFQQGGATVLTVAYGNPQQEQGEPIQLQLQTTDSGQVTQQNNNNNNSNSNNNNTSSTTTTSTGTQQGMHSEEMVLPDKPLNEDGQEGSGQAYPVAVVTAIPPDLILRTDESITEDKEDSNKGKHTEKKEVMESVVESGESFGSSYGVSTSGGVGGGNVADYLSRLPASTLPLSLHHFLKFSAETIKRESAIESSPLADPDQTQPGDEGDDVEPTTQQSLSEESKGGKKKKKYKKKPPKPRRPRPGQVHIAVALDGTTLFCCPECNMAYPDKEMLEQHLVAHKIERRFICDICGAGLKRKEHLERHKLGHNPERPYICSVCCKGFKRKEHLNLHFVIHSGEKSEVCPECGKGFHRKDHLRKHAKSHLAKRVKEEAGIVSGGSGGELVDEAMVETPPTPTPPPLQPGDPLLLQH